MRHFAPAMLRPSPKHPRARQADHRAMNLDAKRLLVDLKRRETFSVRSAEAIEVECLEGCLWITRDREFGDVILAAGEHIAVTAAGVMVVEALRDARIGLTRG
ncbi:MAG: DUF2917 domain-containing protein [Usitatibacter sp.]